MKLFDGLQSYDEQKNAIEKVVSNQIGINFTSRDFLITFFWDKSDKRIKI